MHTAAVLTVSDSVARGRRTDRSGPATAEVLEQHGFDVTQQRAVVDDRSEIEQTLIQLSGQVQSRFDRRPQREIGRAHV